MRRIEQWSERLHASSITERRKAAWLELVRERLFNGGENVLRLRREILPERCGRMMRRRCADPDGGREQARQAVGSGHRSGEFTAEATTYRGLLYGDQTPGFINRCHQAGATAPAFADVDPENPLINRVEI